MIPKDKINQIKSQKCIWPKCNENQFMQVAVQLVKQTGDKIEPVKDVSVPFPMCNFHFIFAKYCYCQADPNKPGSHHITGPWDPVNISEEVVCAMVISGKLKRLIDAKLKAEIELNAKPKKEQPKKNEPANKDSNK